MRTCVDTGTQHTHTQRLTLRLTHPGSLQDLYQKYCREWHARVKTSGQVEAELTRHLHMAEIHKELLQKQIMVCVWMGGCTGRCAGAERGRWGGAHAHCLCLGKIPARGLCRSASQVFLVGTYAIYGWHMRHLCLPAFQEALPRVMSRNLSYLQGGQDLAGHSVWGGHGV